LWFVCTESRVYIRAIKRSSIVLVVTIDISKPLPHFKLHDFHKKITKKAKREATQCIQGRKTILPQKNSLACIGLRGFLDSNNHRSVYFEMKCLYMIIVEGRFYDLRKSKEGRSRDDLMLTNSLYRWL